MSMVVQAIEKRDNQARGLNRRGTAIVKLVGKEMGLEEEDLLILELSALLHDLGMLTMPDKLLEKPGKLTQVEFEKIKKHAVKSTEMIQGIPFLEKVIPQILYHHEKFDGTGYPEGLSGAQIPQASRIIAAVDALEAMTRGRSYKEQLDSKKAVAELQKGASTQFDPEVVAALVKLQESGKLENLE
jgi:HD-GYP domain-containing protein (c-di-GMP phosphodiesterase class II)